MKLPARDVMSWFLVSPGSQSMQTASERVVLTGLVVCNTRRGGRETSLGTSLCLDEDV